MSLPIFLKWANQGNIKHYEIPLTTLEGDMCCVAEEHEWQRRRFKMIARVVKTKKFYLIAAVALVACGILALFALPYFIDPVDTTPWLIQ